MQFIVYNTLGVEIKKQQITANEITNVDLSDLANGTYLYKVLKDGKLYKYDKLVLIK
ncbi:MAG: T9SS type A sorting domain-containing protein [Bacteroidetes bacterium]|nr:T9SS type A sorting domain-containing protein [Bacteroidota bacterium]